MMGIMPLSEQNMIDCDTVHEKGCDGGLMMDAFVEEEVKKGICSEADYPYLATQGTCAAQDCTPVPGSIVKDRFDIIPRKNAALAQGLDSQPVTAAMVATDPTLQFYSSGIYSVEGCGRVTKQKGDEKCEMVYEGQDVCFPDVNHGVLVVGYGRDEKATGDLKTYFKVKNSWGPKWGRTATSASRGTRPTRPTPWTTGGSAPSCRCSPFPSWSRVRSGRTRRAGRAERKEGRVGMEFLLKHLGGIEVDSMRLCV